MQGSRLSDIRDYWTSRSKGYSASVEEDLESGRYGHWLSMVDEHLDGRTGLDVLDVGTGPGFFPVILGREGQNVTGIDVSEAMLEQARASCARHGVPADLRVMDAQNLDFPDASFDVVVSRNVVWNLEDPGRAYSEWLRVLRPGGLLMVFDGNHYLFLHDEEYGELDGDRGMGRIKEHAHMDGVDPSIIERIAEDLPMSSSRRPQWDVDTLISLGVQRIVVSTDGIDSFRMVRDGRTVCLPFSFLVVARKRSSTPRDIGCTESPVPSRLFQPSHASTSPCPEP